MKNIFSEMGLGNETFFSTEVEEGDREYRIPRFVKPQKVVGYYIRIWILKTVLIISTNHGLELKHKDKNNLKILFGISGTEA